MTDIANIPHDQCPIDLLMERDPGIPREILIEDAALSSTKFDRNYNRPQAAADLSDYYRKHNDPEVIGALVSVCALRQHLGNCSPEFTTARVEINFVKD